MLRLRKSSFPARRKQATRKASRCCLHTARAGGARTERTGLCPCRATPARACGPNSTQAARVRDVPRPREDSEPGRHTAWDLNGQKTNREGAGTGTGASGGHVHRRATPGEVAPQEEGPNQEPWGARRGPARSSADTARPCAHRAVGSSPSSPRIPGAGGDAACGRADAGMGEETVTQPNSCDGDQARTHRANFRSRTWVGPRRRGWGPDTHGRQRTRGNGLQAGLG